MFQQFVRFTVFALFCALLGFNASAQQKSASYVDTVELQNQLKRAAAAIVVGEQKADRLKATLDAEKLRVLETDVDRQLNKETITKLNAEIEEAQGEQRQKRSEFTALKQKIDQALAASTQKREEERAKEEALRRQADEDQRKRAEADTLRAEEAKKRAAESTLPEASPGTPGWTLDTAGKCRAWNAIPRPNETLSWSGDCRDGKAAGIGVAQWYTDGKPGQRDEGPFQEGRLDGKGVRILPSGDRYEGGFKEGRYNGSGTYFVVNGNRLEGEFQNGTQFFHGSFFYKDGGRFDGDLREGIKSGKGVFLYASGGRYEGELRDMKPDGRGKLTANGFVYEGQWIGGEKSGTGRIQYANGTIYEGEWLSNKPHGQGSYRAQSGEILVGVWSNGCFKQDGKWATIGTTKEVCGF